MKKKAFAIFFVLILLVSFISSIAYAGAPVPQKPQEVAPEPEPEPAPPPPPPPEPEEPVVEEEEPGCCLWPF